MGWSSVDEINGAARLVPLDPVPWPDSRLWVWLIAAVGVLVVVVGAVLFSPATHSASGTSSFSSQDDTGVNRYLSLSN